MQYQCKVSAGFCTLHYEAYLSYILFYIIPFFPLLLSHTFLIYFITYQSSLHITKPKSGILCLFSNLPVLYSRAPPPLFSNTIFTFCLYLSLSFSLSSVSVVPSSHLGGTAVPACSASEFVHETWAPKTTLQMTSTALSRRATAGGAPCSCPAALSAAAVLLAKPALGHHGSCCQPTARCTAPLTAMVWCRWSVELL